MGNIIIPGQESNVEELDQISIEWTNEDVHPELVEDLELNQHLFPKYVAAVRDSVLRSLRHEDTKPAIITQALLRERVDMCHKALVVMRFDMGMSLRHCFDKLSSKLLEALASGQRVEDLVEASRTRIKDDGEAVSGESWRRDAAPRMHTINDEDLAEGIKPQDLQGDEE